MLQLSTKRLEIQVKTCDTGVKIWFESVGLLSSISIKDAWCNWHVCLKLSTDIFSESTVCSNVMGYIWSSSVRDATSSVWHVGCCCEMESATRPHSFGLMTTDICWQSITSRTDFWYAKTDLQPKVTCQSSCGEDDAGAPLLALKMLKGYLCEGVKEVSNQMSVKWVCFPSY